MKLLIVESPGKVKKIQEILGSEWRVKASVGHVRDLPQKEIGVNAPDFKPCYEPTERGAGVLEGLGILAKKADQIFLATDPDREGEAIAWHLADALSLKAAQRVTFGAITEKDVREGVAAPRKLDMDLVAAQEGRRVLDRFCGYLVSGPLSTAANAKLSAGRVQSPAVRLVVEREREIRAFKSVTHYGVELLFEAVENIADGWKASWLTKRGWLEDGQEYFLEKDVADKVAKVRKLDIVDCEETESRTAPPAPFTTSTLQQAASNALKFKPKRTMELAQLLYQEGHITYMRTDSPNLSATALEEIRAYCETQGWPLADKPRVWKSKDGAQEAHEAIRPTHIEIEDAGDTDDEKALYRLIRNRVLACQLAEAVYAVRVVHLSADVDGKEAIFEARGRTLLEKGWRVVTNDDQAALDEAGAEPENAIPALVAGQKAVALDGKLTTKKTKAPSRYKEAALVRELEKRGIGRPATYAAILDNISSRGYVTEEKEYLVPTPTGEQIVDLLTDKFSFVDFTYTREMEQELDEIACGRKKYLELVTKAHDHIQAELAAFRQSNITPCPECGADLRHIVSKEKGYDFFGCRGCEATFPNVDGKPGPKVEKKAKPEPTKFKCKKCKKPLYRRQGSKDGRAYDFYGCSGFPACKERYETGEDGNPVFG